MIATTTVITPALLAMEFVGSHVSSVAKKNREISVIFLTKDPSMWFYRSQHTKRMPQER